METTLRILVAFGLTLMLVMLRLESARFGTAEYDEPISGRAPSLMRRLGWYILGIGLILAVLVIHPAPESDLRLTVGDRAGGISLGLLLGLAGVGQAVGLAWFHYHRIRLPEVGMYPGAVANEILTAFIDEATFRGALFGFFLWAGVDANLAILGQA